MARATAPRSARCRTHSPALTGPKTTSAAAQMTAATLAPDSPAPTAALLLHPRHAALLRSCSRALPPSAAQTSLAAAARHKTSLALAISPASLATNGHPARKSFPHPPH